MSDDRVLTDGFTKIRFLVIRNLVKMTTEGIMKSTPVTYEKFPENYHNDIDGWGFSQKEIKENEGAILTLDIDFGEFCSLNCPGCFRIPTPSDPAKKIKKVHMADLDRKSLSYNDLKNSILDAKRLGLKSVKFLGKGDMFENEHFYGGKPNGFLDFLEFLNNQEIIPLIFTKGQVLGNDNEVKKHFGYRGINTSEKLIKELKKLNCRIMLGFNAIDDEIQRKAVGQSDLIHIESRNKALELLIKYGFNDPEIFPKTRLSLATNPVTKTNYRDILNLYRWARERHIYAVVTPSMISGKGSEKLNPTNEELINLYVEIYKWNIKKGLQTLEQIEEEGIASYAGGHPCNQISAGMYITLTGKVLTCPGEEKVEGDLKKDKLLKIWENSYNRKKHSGEYNVGCPAKYGSSIPEGFFEEILKRVKESLK